MIVRRLDWHGPQWGGSLVALRPWISPGLPLSHSPLSESVMREKGQRILLSAFRRFFVKDRHAK
jgi:hypothetical protein